MVKNTLCCIVIYCMITELDRRLETILSGSNTEMRAITAAEIINNGGAVEVSDLHKTIYDLHGARDHIESGGRRIHVAETRQQVRRMVDQGYYDLDRDNDIASLTDVGELSAGASGHLLDAGLDTGVSIMSVVGYTAFSARSNNISATHQLIQRVFQDPEKPLPLQTAVEEFESLNGQYKLYYRLMGNLASSGVLNLTKMKISGEFKGHEVVCMTGPDTTTKSGQLILKFVEKYLCVAEAARNNPDSLRDGIDILLSAHEEAASSGLIGPLILRGLETARRYKKR